MRVAQFFIILGSLFLLGACQSDDNNPLNDLDITDINTVDNPTAGTPARLEDLGRFLFWDPILSGEQDIACASCHHPDFGYADGRALSIGVGGEGLGPNRGNLTNENLVGRNSPTIINTAFNGMDENGDFDPSEAPMFWDNRMFSLENQALGPIVNFEEMRGHAFDEDVALDSIVQRLQNNANYRQLFADAFGENNPITSENIGAAIAAFERTITATDSPFDRFQAGNQNAMTQQQIRGMEEFRRIGCNDCHSGPMFSDFELHVLGVPDNNQRTTSDTGANGTYAFRTPTLRNLDVTGPYFHSGVGGNLQQTIQFYLTARNFARNNGNGGGPGGGGNGGPNGGLAINPNVTPNQIDDDVRGLNNFNNADIQDIVAFIGALNDPDFDKTIPASVPSGLHPGGNIE